MSTLLQINTGIFADQSHSTVLANEFTAQYIASHEGTEVVIRDLIADPIPHLDATIIGAFSSEESTRTPQQHDILDRSQALIDELANADAVVVGLPMYNFSVPSQFKAYMDQIARAGITFKYTATGPEGLLKDKPVYVVAARGGIHAGQASDSQTALIKTFFDFIGFKNVQFIFAEGLNMGDEVQQKALIDAKQAINTLTA
ncbi:FMN-dependent NADH-azoreductase [Pseudomonas sp. HK3]|jgi:FMN-dependent NADH-azoreductase